MIAVNKLIDICYKMINVVSPEDSVSDYLSEIGVEQLNLLISELNGQGYISMMQDSIDVPGASVVYFKRLAEGETANPNVINRDPPDKVDGVSRRIGVSWIPLDSCDWQQMNERNCNSLPRAYNYGRIFETIPGDPDGHQRCVGVLRMDGHTSQGLRVFIGSILPTYTLDDTVYLPDAYNNMLIQGLCAKLADWQKLDDTVTNKYDTAFTAAKSLIKRQNITQRMLQCGPTGRSYRDNYDDGMAGYGW